MVFLMVMIFFCNCKVGCLVVENVYVKFNCKGELFIWGGKLQFFLKKFYKNQIYCFWWGFNVLVSFLFSRLNIVIVIKIVSLGKIVSYQVVNLFWARLSREFQVIFFVVIFMFRKDKKVFISIVLAILKVMVISIGVRVLGMVCWVIICYLLQFRACVALMYFRFFICSSFVWMKWVILVQFIRLIMAIM